MKNKQIGFVLLYFLGIFIYGCREDTCDQYPPNGNTPPFTEDELSWVKVKDSVQYFKRTITDNFGNKVVDTVMILYRFELLNETLETEDPNCDLTIKYQSATNMVYFLDSPFRFYDYLRIINYPELLSDGSLKLNSNTILDTCTINGRFYTNVVSNSYEKYAKNIGYIYIDLGKRQYELIP